MVTDGVTGRVIFLLRPPSAVTVIPFPPLFVSNPFLRNKSSHAHILPQIAVKTAADVTQAFSFSGRTGVPLSIKNTGVCPHLATLSASFFNRLLMDRWGIA
jgi:hypothetical protein